MPELAHSKCILSRLIQRVGSVKSGSLRNVAKVRYLERNGVVSQRGEQMGHGLALSLAQGLCRDLERRNFPFDSRSPT